MPNDQPAEVTPFRRVLPQILASTAKNFLLLDLGLAVAFATIVIPALTGQDKVNNANEFLHLTPTQASWLGSIAYICQPVGSLFSGWLAEPLGRKKAMFLVNIPHIIAWILMYNSQTLSEVFLAMILLGLGVGLMEAPIITYVGEICEPSIRGILTACAGISATLGFFIVFLLGSLMPWRNVALICLIIPLATMVAICFVPETPLWLLSKKRPEEALKSLQWLRGWVSPKAVSVEFEALKRYNEHSNSCNQCIKHKVICTHPAPNAVQKLNEITRKRTMKPLLLVLLIFLISQFSGFLAMRPYMVLIMKAYGVPLNPSWATVILGLVGILSNIVLLCVVRVIGKRRVYIVSMTGTFLCCIALGIYGFAYLPAGWKSLEENLDTTIIGASNYLPMFLFIALAFFTNLGVGAIPWMLLSEVFPFKARGYATGLAAGINYLMAFVATKTYYNLESALSMPGVTLFYGCVGVAGFVAVYLTLPETERRTLEEIELHFSDNNRKITDIYIQRISDSKDNNNAKCIEAGEQIGTKSMSVIGDIVEMNSKSPSVVSSATTPNNGPSHLASSPGCDNKAFTNDR